MELTRRGHAVIGTAGTLLLVGVLGDRPLAVVGAATLCAWLLVVQHRAVSRFVACDESLSVSVATEQLALQPNERGTLTVAIEFEETQRLSASVTVEWPVGVDGERPTLMVGPETNQAETTCTFSAPLAGQYELPELQCNYTDESGLFEQRVGRSEHTSIVVETASLSDLQVGGDDLAAKLYGEHPNNQSGSGTDVMGIRRYIPGDSLSRIDWNSTARLGDAYVRELEDESSNQTRIFLDRHESMNDGPPGRKKSDYMREVALGILQILERDYDPVGLTLIDEGGIQFDSDIRETPRHYRQCRRVLNADRDRVAETRSRRHNEGWTGTPSNVAQQIGARLSAQDNEFATVLRPFFEASGSYTQRFDSEPLFNGLRVKTSTELTRGWTVICTDDTRPQETREAVKATVSEGTLVTVFLTPTVLFDGSWADTERTYERYVDFETFRKQLNAMPGVHAYEVAPGERRTAVLEARQNERDDEGLNGGENHARA